MNYKVSEPIKYERKFVSAYRTNVEWGLHIHRHIEIVLVTDGVLRMQISNDVVDIPKGYAAFAESFEPHSFISDSDNDAVIIEFSPEIFSPFSRWLGEYKIGCRAVKIDECISELVTRLLPDDHTKKTSFSEIGEARMLAVLAPLCNAFIDGGEWQRREGEYDDLFIRALVFVSENFDKHLTRDIVAKELVAVFLYQIEFIVAGLKFCEGVVTVFVGFYSVVTGGKHHCNSFERLIVAIEYHTGNCTGCCSCVCKFAGPVAIIEARVIVVEYELASIVRHFLEQAWT